ncbi:indole-3-glycerol-phosphate synthase [Methermicoccus shengliensis]|uniref:indole-3-glycerol-phosphate synthase n=1 Tax=Methermicoccus shengliensis TaxID=660064 RepID=A0A832RSR8_9EURY|nr:indole-3-glycerol-phosphate synthase [Methermicoccus shengliensis]KUK04707.1 MAG: Indole-3-glycerol phosphate synthase [Euryarchaeota archaeon 55_53]KUK30526.1 MAG: Indole-3-glycerol phosphate synthase [Methanosarcinales archeaon 56_1174]MDI3487433.1 indole-3-glycerol phosphate synthase [Methanosarcinales archaeon]MDN5295238.1 indole-3-glycerol phosphate synthase [Methanosarcinales archaeon]HIH69673.1 indole-3-glycerol-phosphate synthase [Methermicoccus shengliensis]
MQESMEPSDVVSPMDNPIIRAIVEHTRHRIGVLRAEAMLYEPLPYVLAPRGLVESVRRARRKRGFGLIAEIKPASPAGTLAHITPHEAAHLAHTMQEAGACAISVLTEPEVFCGSLASLKLVRGRVDVPVLRKDFILSALQLTEGYQDGVLLIASLVGGKLPQLVEQCHRLKIEPLVEVRTVDEAGAALDAGARMLGINNRDLATLSVDLSTTLSLAPLIRDMDEDVVLISESGIRSVADVRTVVEAGVDGVLVGTALMQDLPSLYESTHRLVHAMEAV